MALTFKQLMNNIDAIERDIKQKVEACRVLAMNHCFEEAEVMAIRVQGKANGLADVLEKLANRSINQELKDLKRPIIIFYENFLIPKLFEELLLKKEHIALIIDEYGGMQGLVTMEDIIETILGIEIIDEKDIEVNMQELAKKKWKIRKKNLNIDKN